VLLACSGHAKNGALSVLTQHVTAEVLTQVGEFQDRLELPTK